MEASLESLVFIFPDSAGNGATVQTTTDYQYTRSS